MADSVCEGAVRCDAPDKQKASIFRVDLFVAARSEPARIQRYLFDLRKRISASASPASILPIGPASRSRRERLGAEAGDLLRQGLFHLRILPAAVCCKTAVDEKRNVQKDGKSDAATIMLHDTSNSLGRSWWLPGQEGKSPIGAVAGSANYGGWSARTALA